MTLRRDGQRDDCTPGLRLGACVALLALLTLAGCGGTVANLLPGASKTVPGVPAGPTLGYVFSASDGTLRALLGVRGSAQVSTSIVPPGVYVAGDVSTASSAALLEDGNGSLFAFDLPLSQPVHVADGLPLNAQVVFAPAGGNAVVYAPGATSVMLVSGLPSAPQAQTRSSANAVMMAAVSDQGTVAMVAKGSPTMAVGTLSAAGQFASVASVAGAGGLSFVPGATGPEDLLIADSGANTAAIVHAVSSSPASQALAVPGLNQPVAIAGSQDKHWAVIADGGDQNLFRVDLTGATPAVKLGCACQPAAVSALAGGGTFRLNTLYAGPLWTLDTSTTTPQLLFVPAIVKGSP